ncbi:MAG TPA: tRNA (adenosine(37)-N6)-threonylcarbamoyltransferase complex ATPase subunit type 1 TsaE [Actinomycetota bacterium]|nr:tRNA (adenosine(37)-N6)-threonylcarbamoyltransferase complex ATPase subunit type 1 TsaE [Actinomycetota bacterium]
MTRRLECRSRSPEDTRAIAAAVAAVFAPGDVVALSGDLGAGKTCFVQGAAREMGVTEHVSSPTFVLVREYPSGRIPILHIDVYRLGNLQELVDLGYEEFLDPKQIVLIEWGDAVGPLLPPDYLHIEFHATGDDERTIELIANGPGWAARLESLKATLGGFMEDR